jgi:hypothetical protein
VTKTLDSQRLGTRPFTQDLEAAAPRWHVERHEVARHRHLVEADATYAGDLCVEPRVVVAEKTDPRVGAGNRLGKTFSVALVPTADGAVLASPGELDSGGSIMKEKHVDTSVAAQALALVMGEVALGPSLKITRPTLVVGRTVAAADAPDADPLPVFADIDDIATRQIRQARQNLAPTGFELLVEPDKVFMIALDENRGARSCAISANQTGKSPAPSCLRVALSIRSGSGQTPKSPT